MKEYGVAAGLFIASGISLIVFAWGWRGISDHGRTTKFLRVVFFCGGLALIPITLAWMLRVKADESWSIFLRNDVRSGATGTKALPPILKGDPVITPHHDQPMGAAAQRPTEAQKPALRLFLGCQILGLPVPLTVGEPFNIFHVPAKFGYFSSMVPTKPGEYSFGAKKTFGVSVNRCDLTNDGPRAVFGVQVPMEITRREVVRGTNELVSPGGVKITASGGDDSKMTMSGRDIDTHIQTLSVDRIAASGGVFRFYVWNSSEYFVQVVPPKQVFVEDDGKKSKAELIVSGSADTMILEPMEKQSQ